MTNYIAIFCAIALLFPHNSATEIRNTEFKNLNIVFVIIDTLRADHLNSYGYSVRETTPYIDNLASKAFLFKNAFSPSSWSRTAIASMISSRLPVETGIYAEDYNMVLSNDFITLPKFLNRNQYTTAAIYTNPNDHFGIIRNFDYTHFQVGIDADKVNERAFDWLQENFHKKFFLLLHYTDPHDPYSFHRNFSTTDVDSPYRRLQEFFPVYKGEVDYSSEENWEEAVRLNKDQLFEMEANYDGEIAFLDYHFGQFINFLKRKDIFKNTIIIVTADHGEEFLDHGGLWHGTTLYNELIKVPLIIYIPQHKGKIIHQNVSTIDIFPTLVDLIDQSSLPGYKLTGQSLVSLLKTNISDSLFSEKPVFSATQFRDFYRKYSLIIGHYKIIRYDNTKKRFLKTIFRPFNLKHDPREESIFHLFDLKQDPKELNDLSAQRPQKVRILNKELSRIISLYNEG